ncbi:MAG: DUF2934 domain-containing protein [Phycisphaerales bacterium]
MEDQWALATQAVCQAMAQHTQPFTAAIHRVVSHEYGEPCGTGSYLRLLGNVYLLTNDHVARYVQQGGLSHQPRQDDYAHRIIHPFLSMPEPVDSAISRVDDESWNLATKSAIPASRIAPSHSTAQHELLFLQGYPGERSRWSALANGPISRSVPYLTQEATLPAGLDPRLYFALLYSPEHAKAVDNKGSHLPLPPGFSGTLVWNTNYVKCQGQDWQPDQSEATGLVALWGQNQYSDMIIAVRIEVVRMFLLQALRQEAAYFRWHDQGRPEGSAEADWYWATQQIQELA